MNIENEFNIGDTVYWANYAGVCCGRIQSIHIYKDEYGYLSIEYLLEGDKIEKSQRDLFLTFQEAEEKWKRLNGIVEEEKLKLYNNNGKSTKRN